MLDKETLRILQNEIALYNSEQAYKTLFTECFPALVRYAFIYAGQREAAEEIASDVLFNIWQRQKTLDKIEDLQLYLYISARNAALNFLKKEKRLSAVNIDGTSVWLKADDATPEQLAISAELYQKIQTAIKQLPPKCQAIYKLVKEDGLKYKDVAALLQLSVKTIETQMGIALQRLSKAVSSNG